MSQRSRNIGRFVLRLVGSVVLSIMAASLAIAAISAREMSRAGRSDLLYVGLLRVIEVGPYLDEPLKGLLQAAKKAGLSVDDATLAALRGAGEQAGRVALGSAAAQAGALVRGERQRFDVKIDLAPVHKAVVDLIAAKVPMGGLLEPAIRAALSAVVPLVMPLGDRLTAVEALLQVARVGVVSLQRLIAPLAILSALFLCLAWLVAFGLRLACGVTVFFSLLVTTAVFALPAFLPTTLAPLISMLQPALGQWALLGLGVAMVPVAILVAIFAWTRLHHQ